MADNEEIEGTTGSEGAGTPQERIDNENTKAIQELCSAVEGCRKLVLGEIDRAKASEGSIREDAKSYSDSTVAENVRGVVRSVNGNAPSEDGSVKVDRVERADEIVCKTVSVYSENGFTSRISGEVSGIRPSHASVSRIYGRTEEDEGLLVSTMAKSFSTTGFNWLNPKDSIDGCTISAVDGVLSASPVGRVVFVRVVAGGGGYAVHHGYGSVAACALCRGFGRPAVGSAVTVLTRRPKSSPSDMGDGFINDFYDVEEDGWLCIELSDGGDGHVCVHPVLGGKEDWNRMGYHDYEDYEEHVVEFPSVADDGGSSPNGVFGLASIRLEDGTVLRDEYDVAAGVITRNVGRMAYTQKNLEDVQALGVEWVTDYVESIYYEFRSDDVYPFVVKPVDGDVPACPFGRETMTFGNLEPPCVVEYVENLVGKLSDDVLTVSEQTLTDAEKERVNANIGTRYELNAIVPEQTTVTVAGSEIQVLACDVKDRAVNSFDVKANNLPVFIRLPARPADGRARDFIVRMSIWTQTPLSAMFAAPDGEENEYESVDSDWKALKPGVNLFSFTEVQ